MVIFYTIDEHLKLIVVDTYHCILFVFHSNRIYLSSWPVIFASFVHLNKLKCFRLFNYMALITEISFNSLSLDF